MTAPDVADIRTGQKRRLVTDVLVSFRHRAVVRLSCGHVAFRQYHMSVGQRAYCGRCAP